MRKGEEMQEMSDCITRTLQKKKVLDRWENEGGRILVGPTREDECSPTSDHEGEGDQLSVSHGSLTVGSLTSP